MNHDVFISYSSRNKPTALAICHVLEGHGVRCWMAPRDIPPGADYGDVIDEAIVACRLFVLVFSEPASLSQWVKGELNLAFTEKKIIIPYRIDETPLKGAMRLILNQTHWVDAYPDAESKFGGRCVPHGAGRSAICTHSCPCTPLQGGRLLQRGW